MNYAIPNTLIKLYEIMVDKRYQTMFDEEVIRDNELAIYSCIRIRCNNYGYEKDGKTYHEDWVKSSCYWLHFIIYKHHRVYVSVSQKPIFNWKNIKEWKNIGNHDSCFRDNIQSKITEYYFKTWENCWDYVPKEHKKAPIDSNIEVSFDMMRNIFQLVTVERKNEGDNYYDTIHNIKEFKVKMIPGDIS